MKMHVLAIRDRKLDEFNQPFFTPAKGAGIRAFGDDVNTQGSPANKHPEDYELYELGTFDTELGRFTNLDKPKQLALASDFVTAKQ